MCRDGSSGTHLQECAEMGLVVRTCKNVPMGHPRRRDVPWTIQISHLVDKCKAPYPLRAMAFNECVTLMPELLGGKRVGGSHWTGTSLFCSSLIIFPVPRVFSC